MLFDLRTFWKESGKIASKGGPTVAEPRATQVARAGPDLNKEHDVKCPREEPRPLPIRKGLGRMINTSSSKRFWPNFTETLNP